VNHWQGGSRLVKSRILIQSVSSSGYHKVCLTKTKIGKSKYIHQLVWDHFAVGKRNGRKIQIDHIDNIKSNNSIYNLQLLSARKNIAKSKTNKISTHTGVRLSPYGKWFAQANINGKVTHLGMFKTEEDAAQAYKQATIRADKI
jgi:hypothetical protein